MNDLLDFKARFDSEKNSEASGRIFIARHSNINEILGITASKNITRIDQSTKWMHKSPVFLSISYGYSKKILVIIPSFQKQTP